MKNGFMYILRLSLVLGFTFALMCAIGSSQVPNPLPSHWPWTGVTPAPVPISASAIADQFGTPYTNVSLCFAPVDATGKITGFRVGPVQVMAVRKCGLVSNGVLASGLALAPTPAGIYYHPEVIDRKSGAQLRDYCVTQITGSSWTLDNYDCAAAPGPPPAAGSISPAATGELAIYCGANPTSDLCGIPYQGLYDNGSQLVTAVTGSGAPAGVISCDAAHLFIKYYDGTTPGQEYTCLLVSGAYTWRPPSGVGSMVYPSAAGLVHYNGTAWDAATYAHIIALFTGCNSTNPFTKYDGTCGAGSYTLPAQYQKWACEPGLGDGLNAIPAGTYPQSICYNNSGVTWTITGIRCLTDNSGTSTMSVTNGAGTALLAGAITCSSSWAAGTQSGTVTIASGDYLKFTFVADGTSKQATWFVGGTY